MRAVKPDISRFLGMRTVSIPHCYFFCKKILHFQQNGVDWVPAELLNFAIRDFVPLTFPNTGAYTTKDVSEKGDVDLGEREATG